MTKRLIKKTEFAEEAGVSRAAVTKACAGLLAAAVVGKLIDIDHPDAVAYIRSKQVKKTPPTAKKPRKATAAPKPRKAKTVAAPEPPAEESHFSEDDDIKDVLHLTLAEIVQRHGTSSQFRVWVDAKKAIVDVQTRVVKLAALQKTLIPRELVENHIFGAIETGNLRLLRDTSKAATRKLFTLAKAGGSLDEGELLVRKLISDQLKNVAPTFKRILKNA